MLFSLLFKSVGSYGFYVLFSETLKLGIYPLFFKIDLTIIFLMPSFNSLLFFLHEFAYSGLAYYTELSYSDVNLSFSFSMLSSALKNLSLLLLTLFLSSASSYKRSKSSC